MTDFLEESGQPVPVVSLSGMMEASGIPGDPEIPPGMQTPSPAAFTRQELTHLERLLEEAHARLEVYEFQIESLRKELETYKLDALLHRLHRATPAEAAPPPVEAATPAPPVFHVEHFELPLPLESSPKDSYPLTGWYEELFTADTRDWATLLAWPAPEDNKDSPAPIGDKSDKIIKKSDLLALNSPGTKSMGTDNVFVLKTTLSPDFPVMTPEFPEGVSANLNTAVLTVIRLMKENENLVEALRRVSPLAGELEAARAEMETILKNTRGLEEKRAALESEAGLLAAQLAEEERKSAGHSKEIEHLDERQKELLGDIEHLQRKLSATNAVVEYLKRLNTDLMEEIERARSLLARHELNPATAREQQDRLEKAQQAMRQWRDKVAKELYRLHEERDHLRRENEKLRARLRGDVVPEPRTSISPLPEPAAGPGAQSDVPDPFNDFLKACLAAFEENPGRDTLVALRDLFLRENRFDHGIRVFRQCFAKSRFQAFLPAICYIVGEFHRRAGDEEEAQFYLTNPMIKDDPIAREMIAASSSQPA